MKLPRVRFSVRGLMLLVTLAALAAGGIALWARREHYLALARQHAAKAAHWKVTMAWGGAGDYRVFHVPMPRTPSHGGDYNRSELETWVAYQESMARRYEAAARMPWLAIGAEPPEPVADHDTRGDKRRMEIRYVQSLIARPPAENRSGEDAGAVDRPPPPTLDELRERLRLLEEEEAEARRRAPPPKSTSERGKPRP